MAQTTPCPTHPFSLLETNNSKAHQTRDLTSRDHRNCGDWHRETGQRGTISQGWTSRDLFQCSSRCSLYKLILGVLYALLVGFMFVVIFLSVLLIPTCGRLSWPALDNVWAHYKIVIDCVIDW